MSNEPGFWIALISCLFLGSPTTAFGLQGQSLDPIGLAVGLAFEVPEESVYIAAGDLNDDRFDDAVVVSPKGTVTAVLSAGLGSFASSQSFTETGRLGPLVVVDLDGDSILDIAVIAEGPGSVMFARGIGDGTFAAREIFAVAGNPKVVAAGDVDGDQATDLVVAGDRGELVVLTNRLSSGQGFVSRRIASLDTAPVAIALVDVDADARLDVIILGKSADGVGRLFVVTRPGEQGSTTEEAQIAARPLAMAVADYNCDDSPDVAILHELDERRAGVSVSLNVSERPPLAEAQEFPVVCPGRFNGVLTLCRVRDIVSGDFNGDRLPDLAVAIDEALEQDTAFRLPGLAHAYVNVGDGTFVFSARVSLAFGPQRLAAGELSGDAPEDLVTTELDPDGDGETRAAGVRILRSVRPSYRPDGCFDDEQCATGSCVDRVCCTESECPQGERCDIPFAEGECHPVGGCVAQCTTGEHCESGFCVDGFCCVTPSCPSGYACLLGECEALLPGFSGCTFDEQCDPPHCVDGICCEAACEAPERCNVARFEGICTDPDAFGPRSFGKPCSGPSDCDPQFHCTDGVCCSHPDCGAWHRCNVPGREGECAVLPSLGVGCFPTPAPRPVGAGCKSGAICASGNCVDDTCCVNPSCPPGQRCDLAGSAGTCQPPIISEPCVDDLDCATGNCDLTLPFPLCAAPRTATPSTTVTPTASTTPTVLASVFPTPRPTATPNPVPTATAMRVVTETPAPTATETPVRVADDGCAVGDRSRPPGYWVLVAGFVILWCRVRRTGGVRRRP